MGFFAFECVGYRVPGHGVVIWGHGDGATGQGGDFEPVVTGPFDPVVDGLVDGVMGSGVEADGTPMVVGIVDG